MCLVLGPLRCALEHDREATRAGVQLPKVQVSGDRDRRIEGQRIRRRQLLPAGWTRAQADAFDRKEGAALYALAAGIAKANGDGTYEMLKLQDPESQQWIPIAEFNARYGAK